MTPKEKARELFDKMSFETHIHNAKHCALIAVDEIINDIAVFADSEYVVARVIYWEKVKQEIENL